MTDSSIQRNLNVTSSFPKLIIITKAFRSLKLSCFNQKQHFEKEKKKRKLIVSFESIPNNAFSNPNHFDFNHSYELETAGVINVPVFPNFGDFFYLVPFNSQVL
jgi:hypothetical protein